jgi:hypothetical protein
MPTERDLRVVIFCLNLEVAKTVEPVKHYQPDKVYMFYLIRSKIYRDFQKEVERVLAMDKMRPIAVEAEVWDFAPVLKNLVEIIKAERGKDNKVFVDLHGPGAWSAAAMVACMMEGGTPYFAKTTEHAIDERKVYYDRKGRPRGTVSAVAEPERIETFKTPEPDAEDVRGLKVWLELLSRTTTGKLRDSDVVTKFAEVGLMDDIHEAGETKVSQSATMMYRRGFLEKWIANGWVRQKGRGRYELTDYGKVVVEVFGND